MGETGYAPAVSKFVEQPNQVVPQWSPKRSPDWTLVLEHDPHPCRARTADDLFGPLDVGGLWRISGTPTEIAVRLRADVLEMVGLPVTVGVARTKFLAKVASGVAKPDGLLVVPTDGELDFLHPLPVELLWGVGPATAAKLHEGSAAITPAVLLGRDHGPSVPLLPD